MLALGQNESMLMERVHSYSGHLALESYISMMYCTVLVQGFDVTAAWNIIPSTIAAGVQTLSR